MLPPAAVPGRLHRIPEPPLPPLPAGFRACRFGTALLGPDGVPFCLSPVYATRVHMAVLGESGSGKSKFLSLFVRYLLLLGEGGMLVDPPGDLADEIAAFVAYRHAAAGDDGLVRRVHVLDVTDRRAFRFDPYASLPCRSAVGQAAYDRMLGVKGDRLVRQLLRRVPAEALEVMNRLRPRLKAVVVACGADLDGRGRRLGLGKALALANPDDDRFPHLLGQVYPHLPDAQKAAFKEIAGERVANSAKDRWESTRNALAKVLDGCAGLVLEPGPASVDVKGAIDRGEFVVVRLGQSPHLSYDQGVGLGGLVLDAFLEAKEAEECLPPHLRKRWTIVIDEFNDLLGEDVCWALRNDRKFECRIVVGAQNVATLARGDLNLAEYVLSQCQTIVCFSQKQRKDKEVLEDRLWGGSYGFTPRMTEVQRQRGYVPVQTVDHSVSLGAGRTWAAGETVGLTRTTSESLARMLGWARSWGETRSRGSTRSSTDTRGTGASGSAGLTLTHSPVLVGGKLVGTIPVRGESEAGAWSDQSAHSDGTAEAEGEAHTAGGAEQQAVTRIAGHALGISLTSSSAEGRSETEARGRTVKTSLLANVVSEWEWTGQYEEGSVADQKERHMVLLHRLRQAECVVSVYGHPYAIPVKVDAVDPLWATAEEAWHAGEHIKRVIAAQWPYTFSPSAPGDPAATAPDRDDEDDSDALVDTPLDAEAPGVAPITPFGH